MEKTPREDDAAAAAGAAPLPPSTYDHEDGGGVSHSHSDADSCATCVTRVAGYKRKKRRPAVSEQEDIAILRAIATVAPHRVPHRGTKQRWQQVVDAVLAETGTDVEISRMLCQRRYEILLNRFVVTRELKKHWPENPELRVLLEEAVEARKAREEQTGTTMPPLPPALSLDVLRVALAVASATRDGRAMLPPLDESIETKTEMKDEVAQHAREMLAAANAEDLLGGAMPANQSSPTQRRSFVESTLVAVLDRLVEMEKTWVANAREERQLKREQIVMKREKATHASNNTNSEQATTSNAYFASHSPCESSAATCGSPKNCVAASDPSTVTEAAIENEHKTTEETSRSVGSGETGNNNKTTEVMANGLGSGGELISNGSEAQRDGISPSTSTAKPSDPSNGVVAPPVEKEGKSTEKTLDGVGSGEIEKESKTTNDAPRDASASDIDELKKEVTTLLGSVTASHQAQKQLTQQVKSLSTMLTQVQADKDVLKQDVAMLQHMLRDAASLAGTLTVLRDSHQQHERTFEAYVLQQDARIDALRREVKERHQVIRNQLACYETSTLASIQREREQLQADHRARLAQLNTKMALLAALKAAVDRHQEQLQQHARTMEDAKVSRSQTQPALKKLTTAIEAERSQRLAEYGTLLETIEQVAAGKAKLI